MYRHHMIIFVFTISIGIAMAEWSMVSVGQASPSGIASDSSGNKILISLSNGGFWLTQDTGQTWEPINNRITENSIIDSYNVDACDSAADTLIAYVDTNPPSGHMMAHYSIDGGQNWYQYDLRPFWPDSVGFQYVNYLHILHDGYRMYDARSNGFLHSTSNGGAWTFVDLQQISSGTQGMYLEPGRPDTVYVYGYFGPDPDAGGATTGGILRSIDAGHSFQQLTHMDELTDVDGFIMGMQRCVNGDLLAFTYWDTIAQDAHEPFLVSHDDGVSWEWIETEWIPVAPTGFIAIPERPGRVITGTNSPSGIWISEDYCQTWSRLENGLPLHSRASYEMYRNPYSGHLYVSLSGQGLFRSTDFGDSWELIPGPPNGLNSYWRFGSWRIDEAGVLFTGSNALLHYAVGTSTTFQEIELPFPINVLDAYFCLPVQFSSGTIQFTTERYNQFEDEKMFAVYTSYDQGQNWTTPGETYEMEGDLFTLAIEVDDQELLIASEHAGDYMLVSDDQGANWTTRVIDPPIQKLEAIDNVLYSRSYNTNAVVRSFDAGQTWESIPLPVPDVEISLIKPLVMNDSLYAIFNDIVWVKPEGGNWIERSTIPFQWGAPGAVWDIVTSAEADTFIVMGVQGEQSLWVSYDMGTTWQDNPLEMPWENQGSSVYTIAYDRYRDRLWVDMFGGLAYFDFSENSVHDPWVLQPATFATVNAYPNPFNSSITISYSINTPQTVKLEVYDLLGRHVATLADGLRTPGSHTAFFDATNYASGTYFLRLSTDENTLNRKLVLMK